MIRKVRFILTVPVKVYRMRLFVRVKGHNILWKPKAVLAEVVGKRERVIFAPAKLQLVDGVLVWGMDYYKKNAS